VPQSRRRLASFDFLNRSGDVDEEVVAAAAEPRRRPFSRFFFECQARCRIAKAVYAPVSMTDLKVSVTANTMQARQRTQPLQWWSIIFRDFHRPPRNAYRPLNMMLFVLLLPFLDDLHVMRQALAGVAMEIDQAVAHAVGLVEPDAVLVVHPDVPEGVHGARRIKRQRQPDALVGARIGQFRA